MPTDEIDARADDVEEIRSGHELYNDDVSLTVTFEHLNEPQAIALMAMLDNWEMHGRFGSSRWVEFFVDGDGPFHPSITVEASEGVLSPESDAYDELADVAEMDANRFDAGAVTGWFIDRALDEADYAD